MQIVTAAIQSWHTEYRSPEVTTWSFSAPKSKATQNGVSTFSRRR
jgi:hypothetical protein